VGLVVRAAADCIIAAAVGVGVVPVDAAVVGSPRFFVGAGLVERGCAVQHDVMRVRTAVAPALRAVVVVVGGLFAGTALLAAGCPSYTVIPDDARARLDEKHGGELLFLKQSLYAGRFYDDDRYRLVHPRRFDELTYLRNAEGDAIVPPPADEIIPAGTRVRVERLEWPDGDAVFRRPLYTPRYTTWIFLRVARERGADVTVERKERHILLLPGGLHDEETFEEWFDASLTETDPNPWLVSLPEEQRIAIEQKKPAKGMTYEALTAALGFPDRLTRDERDGHVVETCTYAALRVELTDGIVSSWSTAASDAAADAASDAAAATSGGGLDG
jgi:hypothetical protein